MGGLLFAIEMQVDVFRRQDFLQTQDGVWPLDISMAQEIGHDTG